MTAMSSKIYSRQSSIKSMKMLNKKTNFHILEIAQTLRFMKTIKTRMNLNFIKEKKTKVYNLITGTRALEKPYSKLIRLHKRMKKAM